MTRESLTEEHRSLRSKLSVIAGKMYNDDFGKTLRDFIPEFQKHEKREESLFGEVLCSQGHLSASWPLKGYGDVQSGVKTMLEELEKLIAGGQTMVLRHTFSNFYILACSHMDYEETWIFPLLERREEEARLATRQDIQFVALSA